MDNIRKYFDQNEEECTQRLDDASAYDLNVDELFTFINHAKSAVGKQFLYNLLRCIPKENKIKPYESWLNRYAENTAVQTALPALLKKLDNRDAYDIYPLIAQDYIPYTRSRVMIFRLLQFMPTLLLGLYLITRMPAFLLIAIGVFLVNAIIHYRAKTISFIYSGSMPQLYQLICTARKLADMAFVNEVNPDIHQALTRVDRLKKTLAVFRLDVKLESDIAMIVWALRELFKIFFLLDPLNLNKAFALLREEKKELQQIFTFVGMVDTLQSIATLRAVMPYHCLPDFQSNGPLQAEEIYHPLIPDCVANSFTLDHQSFLVMGSNMSGKTSFVRTVGVNILLAQTIHTAFARSLTLTPQRIWTSISVDDSLMEGESYYLREVLRMKHILSTTTEGHNLILLDELFKGTNTIERIAGAKAVLDFLAGNKQNIILAATHDIELIELLNQSFIPIYFTENIEEGHLSFNYTINYERNTQKNAIRILELYGFPPEVIEDALEVANKR